MKPVEMTGTMQERIKGMVSLRDTVNDLIAYQLEEYGDTVIREKQAELSALYDEFTKKFGPHLTKIRSGLKYYYITMSVKSITYR